MSGQVTHQGVGSLEIRFPYDARLVGLVKGLPKRRWNASEKTWVVPEADVVEVVDLLQGEGFLFDDSTRRLYAERRGDLLGCKACVDGGADSQADVIKIETGAAGAAAHVGDYTVSRLNTKVSAALSKEFPAALWLVGEISGFDKNRHKKTVYFRLVEKDAQTQAVAEVEAILFERNRQAIERRLADAGNPFRIEDRITIRVRARVELYVRKGSFRVAVEDLDVTYTLGEAARRREEIVRRLTAEGTLKRNSSLPFPALPLRVGLVTSIGSDAYNDVRQKLEESGFAFDLTVHGARVQGKQTEPSVLNALDWFRKRSEEFDVILICRGGGLPTDLAWFDSEALARAVVAFPLPVVIGIGHAEDRCVLDEVGRSCKTPTDAAVFLVKQVTSARHHVYEIAREVMARASNLLQREEIMARSGARRLALATRGLVELERASVTERVARSVRGANALLRSASVELGRGACTVPRLADRLLVRHSELLSEAGRRVCLGSGRALASANCRITEMARLVGPKAKRRLTADWERLEGRRRRLDSVDPRRVVERGYAVIRCSEGRVVSDAAAAPKGTLLCAELRRGSLWARSEGSVED